MTLRHDAWTEIAYRRRFMPRGLPHWIEIPTADLRLADAQALAAAGKLLLANRYTDETVYLVVKPPLTQDTNDLHRLERQHRGAVHDDRGHR